MTMIKVIKYVKLIHVDIFCFLELLETCKKGRILQTAEKMIGLLRHIFILARITFYIKEGEWNK